MNIARKGMPIALCNPINNVADSSVLNCIADAMAKIEINDLRVDKITLEKDRYDELITKKGSLDYLCQKEDFLIDGDPITTEEEEALIGSLFGAKLEIADESKVYSERGFIPSGLYVEENMHNDNWRMDFEIKFDTLSPNRFKRKLLQLKKNLTIIVKSRATGWAGSQSGFRIPQSEKVAIETLREMITETDFRKYIIHGFILVKGRSGRVYQIFRNRDHTKIWEKGKLVEEVCVRIKDRKIPPTDNLIAFKVLIETDENEFKKLGNVYNMKAA